MTSMPRSRDTGHYGYQSDPYPPVACQTRQEHRNNHSMADIEAPEDVNTSPAPDLNLDKIQVKCTRAFIAKKANNFWR